MTICGNKAETGHRCSKNSASRLRVTDVSLYQRCPVCGLCFHVAKYCGDPECKTLKSNPALSATDNGDLGKEG